MVKVGIENLDLYLDLFTHKRVGLITNPTGVDHQFKTTIDLLSEKTHLTTLFSPEHGIRGDLQAGVTLDSYRDEQTSSMVYSLYGQTKKPTKDMLTEVDVLCFDIQDVGARFYTYVVTLAYALEAAKRYGKHMVVFDRPNPLGGIEVEGNILDLKYQSFVGYHPIVQRYGLTIGELALMMNDAFHIGATLTVVPMTGYTRSMHYIDTKRHWVLPSPNIPTPQTVYAYLATCLFEGTNVSEGRGTTKPFEWIGAPWLKSEEVIRLLRSEGLPGVDFRSLHFQPSFSKYANQLCHGIEIHVTDRFAFKPVRTGFALLHHIRHLHEAFLFLPPYKMGSHPMIKLLTGGDFIVANDLDLGNLFEHLSQDEKSFKTIKERYHLYDL